MFTQLDILVLFPAALQLSKGEEEKSEDIVIYFDTGGITIFTHRVDASVSECFVILCTGVFLGGHPSRGRIPYKTQLYWIGAGVAHISLSHAGCSPLDWGRRKGILDQNSVNGLRTATRVGEYGWDPY